MPCPSIHTDLYAHMYSHTHIGQRQLLVPRPTQDTDPTTAALTTATGPSHVTVRPLLLWQSRSYLPRYLWRPASCFVKPDCFADSSSYRGTRCLPVQGLDWANAYSHEPSLASSVLPRQEIISAGCPVPLATR